MSIDRANSHSLHNDGSIAICPTVTAFNPQEYDRQVHMLRQFAERLHVDLMDGEFAPTVSPPLADVWWPHDLIADIHIMYQHPMDYIDDLIGLRPNMVIIHAEAAVHHMHFAALLHRHGIRAGVSILQDTPVDNIKQIMHSFDHVLLFSGHLGYHGGQADMGVLAKAQEIRQYYPQIEIGWDGGVNNENAVQLIEGGVQVLNVGGYIHKAEQPAAAYATLQALASQTIIGAGEQWQQ